MLLEDKGASYCELYYTIGVHVFFSIFLGTYQMLPSGEMEVWVDNHHNIKKLTDWEVLM